MSTPYADADNLVAPAARPPLTAVIRSAPFLLLFAAQFLSLVAGYFNYVAVAWLALQLTGSAAALGGVLAAAAVPQALLLLLGGAASDRFSPRSVMLFAGLFRAAVVATVATLALAHAVALWELVAAAVLVGASTAFSVPAGTSLLPRLVASEQLESGNAILNLGRTAAMVLGSAAAGVVVAALGAGTGLAADAAASLLAGLLVIPLPAGQTEAGGGGALRQIVEGIRYVWADVPLRGVLLVISVMNFFALGAIQVGLPALAHARFAAGAAALGGAFAAWGLGSTAGSIGAGTRPAPARLGRLMIGTILLFAAGLAAMWLAGALLALLAVMILVGVVEGASTTYLISWIQRRSDPALQGRVMSLAMVASVGLQPLALAVAGVLATHQLALLFLGSALAIALTAGLASLSRAVREI